MVNADGFLPPDPPAGAAEEYGPALPTLVRYARWLADAGVRRGLLGPRETERLWDRHILNCAAVAELVSPGASLCDVGSGAGLPGVVLAIVRPDIRVTLLEPLLRRSTFLTECVQDLGLDTVSVVRGRAEDWAGRMSADVVTARAVAPLTRLAAWALPLLRPSGELLALKGEGAELELAEADQVLTALGATSRVVARVGSLATVSTTTVIRIQAGTRQVRGEASRRSSRRRR